MHLLSREASAAEANKIEPHKVRAIAYDQAIRNDVVLHGAHATNKCVLADAPELMKRGAASENHIVVDLAVASEQNAVRKDDMVAHDGVVADVRTSEKRAVVSHSSDHAAPFRAGVHGHVLTYEIVGAYLERTGFTFVLQVLRRMSDRSERIYLRAGTDACMSFHDDMRMKNDTFVQDDVGPDHAIGPDLHIGCELRLRVDGGC
ncbi:MAG: hypothetical protein AMXMBFR74_22560 [Parvibaculum sp.]